ncbi:MAG: glycosyltransferase family 4 protein [Sulfitobacter sp.]|uniref:glycosyltransferase n=1 Tax=Alphaproteobacteria TaxID=28211 RepID=UPI0032648A8E
MVRTLLINLGSDAKGGRAQLSDLLEAGLRSIEGEALDVMQLSGGAARVSTAGRLAGRIDGITNAVERSLIDRLSINPPDRVVIDGSNLGRLARIVKRSRPTLPIITFYHNVEARFFFDSLRAAPSLQSTGVLVANTLAEYWATYHSDRRVMLNLRDSRLLSRLYRRAGTDLLPMALRDQYDPAAARAASPFDGRYALFVGGAFYANVEGIAWYARNVAARAPFPTVLIGRGLEAHRERLERWGGIHVIGAVEDLAPWYAHARIVVAPIFSGSGMKTKTAEAFMHGKAIAGTTEAFVGYRGGSYQKQMTCNTPEAFLKALHVADRASSAFDPSLRMHYEQRHSEAAMRTGLSRILSRTVSGLATA